MKRLFAAVSALSLKSWFKATSEEGLNPEIEIQSVIDEAKARDQDLRNRAARVIGRKMWLNSRIERAADSVGRARGMAKQAVMNVDEAKSAGGKEGVGKWNQAALSLAVKLRATENDLASLKDQYETAVVQAERAKEAVQSNALKVRQLSAKRLEMLGSPEQAKMQEAVNSAVQTMSTSIADDGPNIDAVDKKIEQRAAEAMATAELHEVTPEGAEQELGEAINPADADAKLDELRTGLGL